MPTNPSGRTRPGRRRTDSHLRAVLDSSRDVIYSLDLQTGRYEYISPSAEKLVGYSPAELMELDYEASLAMVHPDDVPALLAAAATAERAGSAEVEYRQRTRAGDYRALSNHMSVEHDAAGRPLFRRGNIRDLTDTRRAERELRESEERLQEALRVSRSFAFEWDIATDRVLRSHNCADLLGVEGTEITDDTGSRYFERVHPDDRARFSAMLDGLNPDNDRYETIYRIVRPDGAITVLAESARGSFDSEGKLVRLIGISTDVTQRELAEEALRALNARLEEADRQKNEFIAVLSHEMRNPLAPIRYAIPVLQHEMLSENGQRALAVIDRQLDHVARLVDDLLDVGRITAGKIELRRGPVTLRRIIKIAVERAGPAIASGQHSLKVVVPDEPIWVHGDTTRLSQIITNLLDNSAKYTARGGNIELEASCDADYAVVRVRDDGMGIPDDVLPNLFAMYHQVRREGSVQGGLGIGLALARRLADMHDGTVEAHSDGAGKGAEFVVRLPLAGPEAGEGTKPGSAPSASKRLKVLVVDDNADLVEMLAMVVESFGHEVMKAYDGPSALSAASAYRPDVVLLDLGLPGISGLDVARELRRRAETATAWLVALTGWGQAEDRRETRAAGFNTHLTKPTDPDTLQRLLTEIADGA